MLICMHKTLALIFSALFISNLNFFLIKVTKGLILRRETVELWINALIRLTEFSPFFFKFYLNFIEFYSLAKRNFFLTNPIVSLLCMH